MKNDETRAKAQRALDDVDNSDNLLAIAEQHAADVAAALANAKSAIERAIKAQLDVNGSLGEAKASADAALVDTSGDSANAIDLLGSADNDALDNLQKLLFLSRELDRFAREVIVTYTEDTTRIHGRVSGARGYLRQFYNSL